MKMYGQQHNLKLLYHGYLHYSYPFWVRMASTVFYNFYSRNGKWLPRGIKKHYTITLLGYCNVTGEKK